MLSIQSFAEQSLYIKLWMKIVKNVMSKQYVVLLITRPVRRGVSKGEEDGRRPLDLWVGQPPNGRMAVRGVARPQGV
jgi:hypothetical protein